MTRAEFDAACDAVKHSAGWRGFLIPPLSNLSIRPVRRGGAPGASYWLDGQRISRARAEALIEDAR